MGHLGLVAAGRQRRGGEGERAVAVRVLEPAAHALGRPVARTAELGLHAAGEGDDRALGVAGDPVRGVVVVERHVLRRVEDERDVGPARRPAGAVVLVPGAVDGGLVGVAAGRQGRRPAPHQVVRVQRHLRLLARGHPVAGAAHLRVEAAGHRHRGRLGDRTGAPAATRRRLGGRVADRGVRRGHRQVVGAVAQHGAVLDQRPPRQRGDVVEDAVRRVVVGAERGPLPAPDRPPGERDLVEAAVGDRDGDRRAPTHDTTRGRLLEVHRRGVLTLGEGARGTPHHGRQGRDGDGEATLGVAAQRRTAGRPDLLEGPATHLGAEGDRLGRGRVVERDDVLTVLLGVDAADREDAGGVRRVAVQLGAVGECGVGRPQPGEVADRGVHRVAGVEVGLGGGGVGPDEVVVVVGRHPAREHVLAGVLVAAAAGEALLVAVVDDRLPTGEVHQRVGQSVALEDVVAAGQEGPDPPHVVVAEEGRARVGVGVGVRVVVVGGVEVTQPGGRAALGEAGAGALEAEVQGRVEAALGAELGQVGGVGVVDLAEGEEVVVADPLGLGAHGGRELLPELHVDVLDGVDAEAVDAEVDPLLVDVDHPVDHLGLLGEEVVEADEVAVRRGLAGEGRVTAVVVARGVVEPGRHLDRRVLLGAEDRRVGERRGGVELGERLAPGVGAVVELLTGGVAVGGRLLGDVGVVAVLGVVDDVGGVVGDDVEEDLDAARVRLVDEGLELGVGAEVRVDPREVGDPVAVVARAGLVPGALDGPVLEARRQPDGGGAHPLDVVEPVRQPGDVTPVEEALVGRVEPRLQWSAGEPARVVGGVAVGEAVGHHEVEALAGERGAQRRPRHRLVGVGHLGGGLLGRRHRDPVAGVVVGEGQHRVVPEHQRDVGGAAVGAVRLLPAAVERDLEGVAAGRHLDVHLVRRRPGHRLEARRLAGRGPVVGAAELGLEGADQGDPVRHDGVVGNRRGRHDREGGAGDEQADDGREGRAHEELPRGWSRWMWRTSR